MASHGPSWPLTMVSLWEISAVHYVTHETLDNGYVVATSWSHATALWDDGREAAGGGGTMHII